MDFINESFEYSLHHSDKNCKDGISLQSSNRKIVTGLMKTNDNMSFSNQNKTETHTTKKVKYSSPLPNTLHNSKSNPKNNNEHFGPDRQCLNENFSEVLISHSPHISYPFNSDLSYQNTQADFSQQSFRSNQSIYKLSYDESVTDQSETESPETQVPRSLISDEILLHEADNCSDAGSEDVELIPHRYESETFLKESKHMYVNKLSLAVELLRTQENLPYDEHFRRVSGKNVIEIKPDIVEEMNLGFLDEPSSSDSFIHNEIMGVEHNIITSQSQITTNSGNNTGAGSFPFEDASSEEANEVVVEGANTQANLNGVRASEARFIQQFRQYFTPRGALNPSLCCAIM